MRTDFDGQEFFRFTPRNQHKPERPTANAEKIAQQLHLHVFGSTGISRRKHNHHEERTAKIKRHDSHKRKRERLQQNRTEHVPELRFRHFFGHFRQDDDTENRREKRRHEIRNLPDALPNASSIPTQFRAYRRTHKREHHRTQNHRDNPHQRKRHPRSAKVKSRLSNFFYTKTGTGCNLSRKNSRHNRLRRHNRKDTKTASPEKERHPKHLPQRRDHVDERPATVMPKPVHHRSTNRNDICRKDSRQRKNDSRLHKPWMNTREEHFERDGKAKDQGHCKCHDTSKSRQAETATPNATQLFQVILVLRRKAHPAVLECQRRCRLPHRHEVHELADARKYTRRKKHRKQLVHDKHAQGIQERHHSRAHKRLHETCRFLRRPIHSCFIIRTH